MLVFHFWVSSSFDAALMQSNYTLEVVCAINSESIFVKSSQFLCFYIIIIYFSTFPRKLPWGFQKQESGDQVKKKGSGNSFRQHGFYYDVHQVDEKHRTDTFMQIACMSQVQEVKPALSPDCLSYKNRPSRNNPPYPSWYEITIWG